MPAYVITMVLMAVWLCNNLKLEWACTKNHQVLFWYAIFPAELPGQVYLASIALIQMLAVSRRHHKQPSSSCAQCEENTKSWGLLRTRHVLCQFKQQDKCLHSTWRLTLFLHEWAILAYLYRTKLQQSCSQYTRGNLWSSVVTSSQAMGPCIIKAAHEALSDICIESLTVSAWGSTFEM